ncbi:hypothetical protein [Leifsonia xyli]|uniref:hypothetical protein n=1 Tax=Leifsonia xyli TaxID=1575 RepID=UPI003D67BD90
MAGEHPMNQARGMEWFMCVAESQPPYAVIRRFLFGDPNRPEEWFRVVTWSPSSETRELIGWCRSFEAACTVGWDYRCAFESWRHYNASRRVDATAMTKNRPAAAEMLRFYRDSQKRSETIAPRLNRSID